MRRTNAGFTLLEIVVALAIAGLALVGLFRAGGGGVLAVGTAGQFDEATERAQSRLSEIGRLGAIRPGDSEGDDGAGYRWRVSTRPVATWQIGPPANPIAVTLFKVEVAISWQSGGGRRSVTLTSLRLG
jgi:general secretion pathway protein I